MNVFWHELRGRRKGQIGWMVAIIVFMLLSVVKFDSLTQDAAASQELLQQFPATVQAIFGMSGLDLSTLSGYFGVLFIYILIILSIHAGMLGSGILADEERDRTTEFILVKPRSRTAIVTAKLLAGVVYVAALWLVVVLTTWAAVLTMKDTGDFMHDFWNFMIALGVTQLTVFVLGSFAAALTKNPKVPARLVAIIVFVSYLIFALIKMTPDLDGLKYVSLFWYFDAANIIGDGRIQPLSFVVFGVLFVVGLVGTYLFYRRRDVTV